MKVHTHAHRHSDAFDHDHVEEPFHRHDHVDRMLVGERGRIAALEAAMAAVAYANGISRLDPLDAAAILAALPPDWCGHSPREGARLVEVAIEVFADWMARTKDGHALTMEWGEPDERGMYTPVWTMVDDGMEMVARAEIARLRKIEEAAQAALARVEAPLDWNRESPEDRLDWFVSDIRAALEADR